MVGYDQEHQTVYGKDDDGKFRWADPMTLLQARRKLKELEDTPIKTIYKLVPVKPR
jgi:hypothetical protein